MIKHFLHKIIKLRKIRNCGNINTKEKYYKIFIDNMKILIEDIVYILKEDKEECFNKEEFLNRYTDYFYSYDYIVGDYAYGKLRLKGFNKKNNKSFKAINDFSLLKKYLKENCAFGCKYFILEKENV